MKGFVPPTLRRTPAQQEQRRLFAYYTYQWSLLTDPQREDWADCAALPGYERYDWWGNPYALTGQQLFLATCFLLARVSAGLPAGPPLSAVPPPPPDATAELRYSLSLAHSEIALTPPWPVGVAFCLLDVNYRIPVTADAPSGPFTPFYSFTDPDCGPFDAQALLESRFGNIPLPASLFVQVYSMTTDGRCSLPVSYHWPFDL